MLLMNMNQVYRMTTWLALGGLLLLASSRAVQGSERPFGMSSGGGLLGITFPAVRSGDGDGDGGDEQQAGVTTEVAARLDEGVKRALLLRELDMDNNVHARQLSNKELLRRVRLNQLLDAISASIPTAATSSAAGASSGGNGGGSSGNENAASAFQSSSSSSSASSAPIYRNSRTYPSREASSGDNYRSLRLAPVTADYVSSGGGGGSASGGQRARSDLEQWEPSMLDGRSGSPKSRKSGILGIVWPTGERAISPSGTPPYYSSPASAASVARKPANSAAATAVGPSNAPSTSTVYGANQQRGRSLQPQVQQQQQQQHQHQPQHHRSGTEEVPLHTPVHSQTHSDYEWKRVENARWNNLRGMWGKRSALRDDESLAEKYKELLESESQSEAEGAVEGARESELADGSAGRRVAGGGGDEQTGERAQEAGTVM